MLWLIHQAVRAVTSSVAVRAVWAADTFLVVRPCACGHPAGTHKHYRAGTDCGSCGPALCPAYRYRPLTRSKP